MTGTDVAVSAKSCGSVGYVWECASTDSGCACWDTWDVVVGEVCGYLPGE